MEVAQASKKSKGPILDPGLCRGCRSIKKCRLLTAEYEWMGKKEVYSDMFMDVFGLLLSHLDGDSRECCICATCVSRLREASAFHHLVLQSEEMFLEAKLADPGDIELKVEVKTERLEDSDTNDDGTDLPTQESESAHPTEDNRVQTKRLYDRITTPVNFISVTDNPALTVDTGDLTNMTDDLTNMTDNLTNMTDNLTNLTDTLSNMTQNLNNTSDVTIQTDRQANGQTKLVRKAGSSETISEDLLEKDLKSRVKMMKNKLENMADKPVTGKRRQKAKIQSKQTKRKKKQQEVDEDGMIFANAVVIVNNSYVCPFHNRISNYYCFYCKDQFTSPDELREHTLQHDPVELFECTVENKKVPKIDITRIDCRLCDVKIDDLDAFKAHITSVHGKTLHPVNNEFLKFRLTEHNLTCTECSKTFPYFDSLKKHMIEHFGTYVCDICGACFLERNSFRTHIKSHSKVDSNFPCEICGKNLKSKYSRYLHVATVHEKKPIVNCYKCEESFLSYALRNRHLIEVHGDKRTFPCKSCDKVYNRRKTLMEHNRRNHLKVFKHLCPFCDQKFYLPSRLREHLATHTGLKYFKCQLCNKGYPRLQSLQDHFRLHANERKFKCHLCTSVFSQHAMLKSHLRNHHTGYAPNPETSFT